MRELFVGVTLILLALMVGVVFLVDLSRDTAPRPPLPSERGLHREPDGPAGHRVDLEIRREDETRGALPDSLLEYATRPGLVEPTRVDPEAVDRQGYLHYELRPYESLADLARRYLGDEELWTRIRDANPDLQGPQDMVVGRTVLIPLWLRRR